MPQAEDFLDLLQATQEAVEKNRFEDIAADIQEYHFLSKLASQMRIDYQAGTSAEIPLLTASNGNSRFITELEVVTPADVDGLTRATANWRTHISSYFITRAEYLVNRAPEQILSLVKKKRAQCLLGDAEVFESAFWGTCGVSDNKTPYGIGNIIVRNATEGFTGGDASGWSSTLGLSSTTTPNWKNYSAQYAAVSKTDMLRKVRQMLTKTLFISPIGGLTNSPTNNKFALFTNYDVIQSLEEVAEQQNDQLGNDVSSMDGMVMIRKTPVQYVPHLDSDTGDPLYSINFSTMLLAILGSEWMREENFGPNSNQPLVSTTTHKFSKFNLLCRNRRRNGVVYK